MPSYEIDGDKDDDDGCVDDDEGDDELQTKTHQENNSIIQKDRINIKKMGKRGIYTNYNMCA